MATKGSALTSAGETSLPAAQCLIEAHCLSARTGSTATAGRRQNRQPDGARTDSRRRRNRQPTAPEPTAGRPRNPDPHGAWALPASLRQRASGCCAFRRSAEVVRPPSLRPCVVGAITVGRLSATSPKRGYRTSSEAAVLTRSARPWCRSQPGHALQVSGRGRCS